MPDIPHKFAKTRRGQIRVKYNCPACDTKLESELAEAGSQDACPDCGTTFQVPGLAKRKAIEAELRQKAIQRKEAEELRKREEAAKRQNEEAAAKLKAEEERKAVEQREAAAAAMVEQADDRKPVKATPAPPWAPPQPSFQEPASFASSLPVAGNTAYPALEIYAAFFVAAEFIKLALEARRDIATNVELTRMQVVNSNR